jgi:hypothetical protein
MLKQLGKTDVKASVKLGLQDTLKKKESGAAEK